jgi:hypothetical protein
MVAGTLRQPRHKHKPPLGHYGKQDRSRPRSAADAADAPKLEAVIVDLSASRGRENDRKHVNAAEMPSEPSAAAEREQSAKRLTRASRLGDLVQKMAYGGLRVHLYRVPRQTIRSKFYL